MIKKVIVSSKGILSGTPVFVGTRVPVQTLLDYIEAGDSIPDFLDDFPTVKEKQAIAVIEKMKHWLSTQTHARAA